MAINHSDQKENNQNSEIIKEEINLQFHWYMFAFFIIYFGSFLLPGVVFMCYIMLYYLPNFLEKKNFLLLFTEFQSLLASIFMPFILIICYILHLFLVGLITRWLWAITEKKSPSKSGIIPRNIPSKTLNYYHIRSFLIKYPRNAVNRGPFPWLIKWLYNFVKTNKIGKGTTLEENIGADRFVEMGENCYFGQKGAISSHAVEGIFGNISYEKIKIGNNVTAASFNCIAPGVEIGDNSSLLPMTGATKRNILKGNNYYFGAPLRKIFKKRLMDYLDISEVELEKADKLYNQKE
ncbi:MAG: hypothetical protein ACFFHD_11570 [Promethearchaeota archaeon]